MLVVQGAEGGFGLRVKGPGRGGLLDVSKSFEVSASWF